MVLGFGAVLAVVLFVVSLRVAGSAREAREAGGPPILEKVPVFLRVLWVAGRVPAIVVFARLRELGQAVESGDDVSAWIFEHLRFVLGCAVAECAILIAVAVIVGILGERARTGAGRE